MRKNGGLTAQLSPFLAQATAVGIPARSCGDVGALCASVQFGAIIRPVWDRGRSSRPAAA
jgi:hypothetical protein